jgi:hypothetical protein
MYGFSEFYKSLVVSNAIEHAFITLIMGDALLPYHMYAFMLRDSPYNIVIGNGYVCSYTPFDKHVIVYKEDEKGVLISVYV